GHRADNVFSARAEGNAHTQFTLPLRHEIRLNAVQAADGEAQSKQSKRSEEPSRESFPPQDVSIEEVVCRDQIAHGLPGLDAMHIQLDCVQQAGRIASRSYRHVE